MSVAVVDVNRNDRVFLSVEKILSSSPNWVLDESQKETLLLYGKFHII